MPLDETCVLQAVKAILPACGGTHVAMNYPRSFGPNAVFTTPRRVAVTGQPCTTQQAMWYGIHEATPAYRCRRAEVPRQVKKQVAYALATHRAYVILCTTALELATGRRHALRFNVSTNVRAAPISGRR